MTNKVGYVICPINEAAEPALIILTNEIIIKVLLQLYIKSIITKPQRNTIPSVCLLCEHRPHTSANRRSIPIKELAGENTKESHAFLGEGGLQSRNNSDEKVALYCVLNNKTMLT